MEELTTNSQSPRIYVACLAAYNAGHLHGAWVEAAQEPWTIYDAVQNMLRASPVAGAEEWAIHDYDGFGEQRISDSEGLDTVSGMACFIVAHGAVGVAVLDHFDGDVNEAREAMATRYLGAHASVADYIQDLTEESGTIPAALQHHIDWQAMARDAELNGELLAVTTAWEVVHVFAGC